MGYSCSRPHLDKNWEEIAQAVGRSGTTLASIAKDWTMTAKCRLAERLTDHLQDVAFSLDAELPWVPISLMHKALENLIFTVKTIGGEDNLASKPKVELVHGCRFVSLEYPCGRSEQWIFADANNKLHVIFGRDWFEIEKF